MSRTLTPVDIAPSKLTWLKARAQRIVQVYPGSPAEELGLRVGWAMLLAGKAPPVGKKLEQLRLEGASSYLFYNHDTGDCYELAGGPWPLGLKLSGVGTRGFRWRVAMDDNVDDELFEAFGRGDLDEFARMLPAFRMALGLVNISVVGMFGRGKSRDRAIAKSNHVHYLGFLALAHLAAGETDRAGFFANAARDAASRSPQRSFSLLISALLKYVDACVFRENGDHEASLDVMYSALGDAPQFEILRDTYAIWSDSPPLSYNPRWVGENVPFRYTRARLDPRGFWTSDGTVSLKDCLDEMGQGQIFIVVLMPGYRSNYYYNKDLIALAALHANDPTRIAGLHVLSDSTYALDDLHRQRAETIARDAGLPVTFLYDENDDFAEGLELYRAPTTLVLNRAGKVLANGVFDDESAYWDAIRELGELQEVRK